MLKADRHFPHIEAGPTSEGNKDNACLGDVACFLDNLVGEIGYRYHGWGDWNGIRESTIIPRKGAREHQLVSS